MSTKQKARTSLDTNEFFGTAYNGFAGHQAEEYKTCRYRSCPSKVKVLLLPMQLAATTITTIAIQKLDTVWLVCHQKEPYYHSWSYDSNLPSVRPTLTRFCVGVTIYKVLARCYQVLLGKQGAQTCVV
jgi:hypothetical protein